MNKLPETVEEIKTVTDRELQEAMYWQAVAQEKHLRYFSIVLTVFLMLSAASVGIYIINLIYP